MPNQVCGISTLRLYTACPDHGQHTAHSIQQPKTSKAKMLLPTMGVASSPRDKRGQAVSKKQGYTVGHPYIGVCVCVYHIARSPDKPLGSTMPRTEACPRIPGTACSPSVQNQSQSGCEGAQGRPAKDPDLFEGS